MDQLIAQKDSTEVKYFYKKGNLTMFLMNGRLAYQFEKYHYPEGYKAFDPERKHEDILAMEELAKKISRETYRMDIELVGANQNCEIITEGKSPDYIQYYNHNALGVHAYQKIIYKNIYPNIDWVIYQSQDANYKSLEGSKNLQLASSNSQLVKYDFIVHPGGNPSLIKFKTHWVEDLNIKPDGSLTLVNRMGSITEKSPFSYQEGKEIPTEFIRNGNQLEFKVNSYDKTKTLVIDPEVVWATYYGGTAEETVVGCKTDNQGNVYMGGSTKSTTNIASGGYQNTKGIGGTNFNAYLVKFSSSGLRMWATYYGNISTSGDGIAIDNSDNVYLSGSTASNTGITTSSSFRPIKSLNHNEAFLIKFNGNGNRLWGTYYGGDSNTWNCGCAVDKEYNVYIIGSTHSTSGISYNGFQSSISGSSDFYIAKFDSIGNRIWATYYGGVNQEFSICGCNTDNYSNLYFYGRTGSSGLSYNTNLQTAFSGNVFAKFNSQGSRLWSSYYGPYIFPTFFDLFTHDCVSDKSGNIYFVGRSNDTNMVHNVYQIKNKGDEDGYILKLDSMGRKIWSTYYGGSGRDFIRSIDITSDQKELVIAGISSTSTDMSLGGFKNSVSGYYDGFIAYFDTSGNRKWGTYFGGPAQDGFEDLAISKTGGIYLAGETESNTGIAYKGFQSTNNGGSVVSYLGEAMLVKLGVMPAIQIQKAYTDTQCAGTVLNFTSTDTFEGDNPQYGWKINNMYLGGGSSIGTNAGKHRDSIQCYLVSSLSERAQDTVWSNKIEILYRPSDSLPPIFDTMCELQSYWFNNQTFYNSGVYRDTFISSQGCDSFVFLHLHVKDTSYHAFSHITPCDPNASFMFNGLARTQSGTYSAKYLNALGCDSTAVLNLTIRKPTNNRLTSVQICPNSSYIFDGIPRTTAGDYIRYYTNTDGCSSTDSLRISILNNPAPQTNPIPACAPFTYRGKTYTSSATVVDTIKSTVGNCDSVYLSNIIQLKPPATKAPDTNFIVCDSIRLNNKLYTTSFSFMDTFRTVGTVCDSVHRKTNYIIRSTPQIGLKERDTFMRGSQVTLRPFSATNYLWSTGESTKSISFKLTEDRQLYLIAWNEEPCRDTAYISLVAEDLAIVGMPTGFSPTGEHAENFTLRPNINGRLEYLHMMVFNRWGEKVYETFDTQPLGWNGIFKGELAPSGLYGYVMEYRTLGLIYNKTGEVMLVR